MPRLDFVLMSALVLCLLASAPARALHDGNPPPIDRDAALFGSFADSLRNGDMARAERLAAQHARGTRRTALEAVLTMYKGDIAAGEAVLDRIAAESGDERLLEQLSTLYERRDYAKPLYGGKGMEEPRFKEKGMFYLEAAVRARLRRVPFTQPVKMLPPLRGRWNIFPGPMPGRAYHSTYMGFFGYDMWYPGKFEDSFGKPIHSVADGKAIRVIDGNDDNPPGVTMNAASKMNIIIIEHAGGVRSIYCHLRKGSARLRLGEAVRAGEQIAEIGNSGFTGGPHLHFEIARLDDDFTLPVSMSGLWRHNEDSGRFEPHTDPSVTKGKYSDQPYSPSSGGTAFTYDGGKVLDRGNGDWEEVGDDGRTKARFRESGRDGGVVLLLDSRGKAPVMRFPARGGLAERTPDGGGTWRRFQVLIQD